MPGNDSGPGGDQGQPTTAERYTKGTTEHTAGPDETAEWAHRFIRSLSALPLPEYGSADFIRAKGPVRLASALRAAEAWRLEKDPHVIAARLDLELQAAWRAAEEDYDGWRTLAGRIRASASQPDFDELQRRRAS